MFKPTTFRFKHTISWPGIGPANEIAADNILKVDDEGDDYLFVHASGVAVKVPKAQVTAYGVYDADDVPNMPQEGAYQDGNKSDSDSDQDDASPAETETEIPDTSSDATSGKDETGDAEDTDTSDDTSSTSTETETDSPATDAPVASDADDSGSESDSLSSNIFGGMFAQDTDAMGPSVKKTKGKKTKK